MIVWKDIHKFVSVPSSIIREFINQNHRTNEHHSRDDDNGDDSNGGGDDGDDGFQCPD